MIRFADSRDFDAVLMLWKRCFPGDEAFTQWFFENQYHPAVTLLDEENGKLCAMLQMLPYQLRDMRDVRPVTYIYGACTAPEYRRQHRMDRLLQYSFELDRQAGRSASILIPQEEWLFGFYDQFGYQPAFFVDTQIIDRMDTQKNDGLMLRRLTEADIPAMQSLYPKDGMYVLRSEDDWRAQLSMFDALGMGVFGLERGDMLTAYAFVWQDGADKLWAQEACGAEIPALAQAVMHKYNCEHMRVTMPGIRQKLGCIRYHDDTPVQNGYFNLLFN